MNYSTAKRYGDRFFQSSVYHIDNTPNVPNQGLQVIPNNVYFKFAFLKHLL